MRPIVLVALLVLCLPPAAFAQTSPPPASTASPGAPAKPAAGGVTRDQYVEHAKDRAGQRAAARFDQMDTNHDGVVDQAELKAWRSRHARHARSQSGQAPPQ